MRVYETPGIYDERADASGGGIAALPKDQWRSQQACTDAVQNLIGRLSGRMPLVCLIPNRKQADGVQEDIAHG